MAGLAKTKGTDSKRRPPVVRGSRQKRLLSEAIQLEEEVVPQFLRPALLLIGLLVAGAIGWSSIVELKEVAHTTGEVVPSGSIKVVQHPDGGIVREILVKEGELVDAGQALLRLDAAQAASNLEQMRAREAALRLRAERLRAFAEGRDPDFWAIAPDFPDLIADQNEIWRTQVTERASGLEVLSSQIEQRRREVEQMRDALTVSERQQALTGDLLEMRRKLAEKKLVSQVIFVETQRAKATADGEVQRLRSDIAVGEQALSEVKTRRDNLDSRMRQDALNEMGTVTAELAEVESALDRSRLVSDRLEIRAPVRGLVQNLKVTTEGEVIRSSDTVMHIVPMTDILEAEVRIPTREIGHLRVGQPVTVKLTSYNYARFGSVDGQLRQISATSVVDEAGQPYFRGWVTLKQNYLGTEAGRYPVLPGMSVQADIVTGEKTLLQYLVKPVSDALGSAFQER